MGIVFRQSSSRRLYCELRQPMEQIRIVERGGELAFVARGSAVELDTFTSPFISSLRHHLRPWCS